MRELPLPTSTRLKTLEQASATLQLCHWRLTLRLSELHQIDPQDVHSLTRLRQGAFLLRGWLIEWEVAFSDLLCTGLASMHQEHLELARKLKASHLGCNVLAYVLLGKPVTLRKAVDADISAILKLASTVTQPPSICSTFDSADIRTMIAPLTIVERFAEDGRSYRLARSLLLRLFSSQLRATQPTPVFPSVSYISAC